MRIDVMVLRCIALSGALISGLASAQSSQQQLWVVRESTLGTVPVGISDTGKKTAYRMAIALIVPASTAIDAWDPLTKCSVYYEKAVTNLKDDLDKRVDTPAARLDNLPPDAVARNNELRQREERARVSTQSILLLFKQRVVQDVSLCYIKNKLPIPNINFGLISLPCISASGNCKSDIASIARMEKVAGLYSFGKKLNLLTQWTKVDDAGAVDIMPPGIVLTKTPLGEPIALTQLLGDIKRKVDLLRTDNAANRTAYVRPIVAAIAEFSQVDAIRIADVFASPVAAVNFSWNASPVITQASAINDEIARTRISECYRFRGMQNIKDVAASAAAIGTCAGYSVDPIAFTNCITGAFCMPSISGLIDFKIALTPMHASLKDLATNIDLPRVFQKGIADDAFQKAGYKCASQNRKDPAAMATCLAQAQFPDNKVQAVFGCAKELRKSAASCLDLALNNDEDGKKLARCILSQTTNTALGRLGCAFNAKLGSESARSLTCVMNAASMTTLKNCVQQLNNDAARATKIADCLSASNGSVSQSAVCIAQTMNTDENAGKALGCLSDNGGDYQASAGCFAASQLTGTAGLIVRCGAASGGDPMGTAVCAAGRGLTPEQQIALECAVTASTGPGYAACVGGRLTLKEFYNCQDDKFADGKCFGENNELRKFARNVFGTDIGPNSAVADMMNVQIDVAKGTIALAEGTARDAGNAIGTLSKTGNALLSSVGKAAQDLGQAAEEGFRKSVNSVKPEITVGNNGISVGGGGASVNIDSHGGITVHLPSCCRL